MFRFLLAALVLAPLAAHADIDPGNWEMTVTSSFEGMPGAVGPIVQARCFTQANASDPSRMLGSAATPGCEFSNRRDSDSEFSFELKCSGQVPMQGSGRVRYGRETMDAEISLSGSADGQKFSSRSRISGRRLGPC